MSQRKSFLQTTGSMNIEQIPQKDLELSDNLMVWFASFKSSTKEHLYLELLMITKASLIKGNAKFTLFNLLFKT